MVRGIRVLCLWCLALCFQAGALFAQPVFIFIPDVTGRGSAPDDPYFFTQMLIMETAARNYPPGESRDESPYSMNGTLSPVASEYDELGADPLYSLHLQLVNNDSGEVLVEQELVYAWAEETNAVLPLLVFTMLANIPPPEPPAPPEPQVIQAAVSDAWRQKWWYFGGYASWGPRVYTGDYQSANLANFGFGLETEIQFLNFLSFEAGVELAQDWVVVSRDEEAEYRGHVLEIPALLKLVIKPGVHFMIEPYAGLQLNIPLNEITSPPPLSWTAGLQYAVKAGPGGFFVDARAAVDMGDSTLARLPENTIYPYRRYAIKLAAGYKIGVFSRNKQKPPEEDGGPAPR
jgi:hypothetical protein